MVKALGVDIKDFWNNGFPADHYYEDDYEDVIHVQDENGDWILNDTEKYDLKNFGWIIPENEEREGKSFATFFKAWQTKQKITKLVIEVDNNELEKVLAELEKIKGLKVKK